MSTEKTHFPTDFYVNSIAGDPKLFIELITSIKNSIKASELQDRLSPNEPIEAYITRLATSSLSINTALFRKSDNANAGRVAAWTAIVKSKAEEFLFKKSPSQYKKSLDISCLREISRLSTKVANLHDISDTLFQNYGIVLVIEKAFTSMKLDGCTLRLASGHPMIGLSIRYPRYDYFWFTLMHELSHIVLHYDYLDQPILDDLDSEDDSSIEIEANRLAINTLVSPDYARRIFRVGNPPAEHQITSWSKELNIHPAILAGMFRKRMNAYNIYSNLIDGINVREYFGIQ